MNRAHLITCHSYEDYEIFIAQGYVGLYPIPVKIDGDNDPTVRALGAKLTTNWDIIADLKRVKPDDYIFLHVRGDGRIFGPFIATSFFLESPLMPPAYRSVNLNIDYWLSNYRDPDFPPYPWRVGIKSIAGETKEGGFNSMELFKLKSTGSIHSLPERFLYHDKPKIVKPLLCHETEIIIKLLKGVTGNFLTASSISLSTYQEIELHLKPYNGELYREKILEAWLMENATLNGSNRLQHDNIRSIFGDVQHFVNSIFTYYTNFMDVLFYNESAETKDEYCRDCEKYTSKNKTEIRIVELKKGKVNMQAIHQVMEYRNWALKSLADNDCNRIKMFVVGSGFTRDAIKNRDIACIRYSLLNYAPFLKLEKIN